MGKNDADEVGYDGDGWWYRIAVVYERGNAQNEWSPIGGGECEVGRHERDE